MLDQAKELQNRSKKFAVSVIKFYKQLPKTDEGRILGKQLLRSSTSVAANYRSVCRSRSRAEFIAKMGIVVEEVDESLLWFEVMTDAEIVTVEAVKDMMNESKELLHIFSSSLSTARSNDRMRKLKQL
jgi:four helix bundle protein